MSYYDALVAKWATLASTTTAAKLNEINTSTITGQIPTSFYTSGDQILNAINYPEFKALTAAQQTNLLLMLATPGQLLGGSATTTHMVSGMIVDYFLVSGPNTIAGLTALARGAVVPWWQSAGYSSPIGLPDLTAAGGLS